MRSLMGFPGKQHSIGFWWVALLALGLVACGDDLGEDLAMGDGLRQATALEVLEQGLQVCGDGPTVFGIDVSKWQGDPDWNAIAGAGVRYAFIRVSDGLRYEDRKFARNWAEAGRVGILRGAYQFFRPGQDAVEQADYLIARIRAEGPMDLPPVIDVEATDGLNAGAVEAAVGRWIDRVESTLGVRPIIYSGKYFWQDNVGNTRRFADYPLWHAQYTGAACPNIADAWPRWTFWQYSSSGRVAGVDGDVDVNRFNGDEAALAALAVGDGPLPMGPAWAADPEGQSFPLASAPPIELCLGETLEGHISLRNTGTAAWDQAVRLAPTPRDRASALADASWISQTRITGPDQRTEPGALGRFTFTIRGNAIGRLNQTLGLVSEGESWFADDGGPPDDYLELAVNVRDCGGGPVEPPITDDIIGDVEIVGCSGIEGWAAAPSRGAGTFLDVHVVFDGDTAQPMVTRADWEREAACGEESPCSHAFVTPWPNRLRDDDTHVVQVVVVEPDGNRVELGVFRAGPCGAGGPDPQWDAGGPEIIRDAGTGGGGSGGAGGSIDLGSDTRDGGPSAQPEQTQNSGCSAADSGPAWPWALLGLPLLVRRRRR